MSTLNLDPANSRVSLSVRKLWWRLEVEVPLSAGRATLDEEGRLVRLAVKLEAQSAHTAKSRGNDYLRSAILRADEHLSVVFRSTQVELVGQQVYAVSGDLTLQGVTRPVSLEAHLDTEEGLLEARGVLERMGLDLPLFPILLLLIGKDVCFKLEARTIPSKSSPMLMLATAPLQKAS